MQKEGRKTTVLQEGCMKPFMHLWAIMLFFPLFLSCNSDMIEKGMESAKDPRRPDINVKQGETDILNGDTFHLKFANGVNVNSASEPQLFTIENTGTADLEISQITLLGDDSDQFIFDEPESLLLSPGTNTTFRISFTPEDTGSKTAAVRIETNDSDETEYSFSITAISNPVPDFTARLRKGFLPLRVEFEDNSTGNVTQWAWDFDGDGETDSTEQNPVYVYTDPGTFSVVLTVTGSDITNTSYKIKNNYVIGQNPIQNIIVNETFNGACSVHAADMDNDGDIDVLGAAFNDGEISWWENDGTGSFGSIVSIDTFTGVSLISAAYINIDSSIDVIAAGGNEISYWINDGTPADGGWTKNTITNSFTNVSSIIASDLDDDGDMDIVGAAEGAPLSWWRNEAGTISAVRNTIKTGFHNSVYAAKINGDNYPDVITSWDNTVSLVINDGTPYDGGWTVYQVDTNFENVKSVIAADLDGDGDNDIIGIASGSTDEIAWWKNTDGNGTFGPRIIIDTQFDDPVSLYAADLDNDNDTDLVVAGGNMVVWFENNGTGSFGAGNLVDSAFKGANSIFTADFDGDGFKDILGARTWDPWWGDLNYGTISWWKIKSEWYRNTLDNEFSASSFVISYDLDGDGDMDVIGSAENDGIAWWENKGNDYYLKNTICSDCEYTYSLYAVDVDSDGDMDILSALEIDGILWIENSDMVDGNDADTDPDPGTGNGTMWKEHLIYDLGGDCSVFAADMNGDHIIDVLGAAYGSGQLGWWENDNTYPDDGTVWNSHLWNIGTANWITSAYIDNDNYPDLVAASSSGLVWWENIDGTGSFPNPTVDYPSGSRHRIDTSFTSANMVLAIDIDKDDDIDLIGAAGGSTDEIAWYENNGDGTFGSRQTIAANFDGAVSVYVADINGDGYLDVIGAAGDAGKISWWENVNGSCSTWREHPVTIGFGNVSSVSAADVDGDGDVDILGTSKDRNEIVIWENNMKDYGPQ